MYVYLCEKYFDIYNDLQPYNKDLKGCLSLFVLPFYCKSCASAVRVVRDVVETFDISTCARIRMQRMCIQYTLHAHVYLYIYIHNVYIYRILIYSHSNMYTFLLYLISRDKLQDFFPLSTVFLPAKLSARTEIS